jgi:hypothetical protein
MEWDLLRPPLFSKNARRFDCARPPPRPPQPQRLTRPLQSGWDRAASNTSSGGAAVKPSPSGTRGGPTGLERIAPIERSARQRFWADPRRRAADPEEHTRRARVATVWEQRHGEQRGRPGALPLPTTPERLHFAGWPAGVEIERQRWTMAFDSTGEWLEKRVALAPALAEGFRRPWKPNGKPPRIRLELHPQRGRGAPSLPYRKRQAACAARTRPVPPRNQSGSPRPGLRPWGARPNTGRNCWTSGPLRLVAGGYQLITKPDHHAELQQLLADLPKPTSLSRAALETAADIALQQPVTAAEVQARAGCPEQRYLRPLLKRKLIPPDRAPHPLRYRTTTSCDSD